MGRSWAELTIKIQMPDMAGDPLISIQGHYTGYPSGGVPQSDKDFELFVERDAPEHSVRKIVSRLIAYYLSRDL